MKTLADALAIRRRVFGAFELAETADGRRPNGGTGSPSPSSAPGRPGSSWPGRSASSPPTRSRDEFRRIDPEEARVLLFDGGARAARRPFGPKLSARAARTLTRLGVELHLHSTRHRRRRREARASVTPTRTAAHHAGTTPARAVDRRRRRRPRSPDALAKATGAEQDRAGRISVEPDLTIPGHPEISVVGDLMSLDQLPGVAEVAMQAGLLRRARGSGTRSRDGREQAASRSRYRDFGSAAYISRGRAVVTAGPVQRRRLPRLAGLAGHPHRVPDRLPQPARRRRSPGWSPSRRIAPASGRSRRRELDPAGTSTRRAGTDRPPAQRRRHRQPDRMSPPPPCSADTETLLLVASRRSCCRPGADGIHPDGPHHPGAARRGAAVHHPGDELLGLRRNDAVALQLARRWSAVMAVQFAVGVVTGTCCTLRVRPALAGPDGPLGRRLRHRVRHRGVGVLPRGGPASRSISTAGGG